MAPALSRRSTVGRTLNYLLFTGLVCSQCVKQGARNKSEGSFGGGNLEKVRNHFVHEDTFLKE